MLTSVVSAWLATPRPPSAVVPIRPTMAASASRNSGSATRAPNAGTASRRISASCGLRVELEYDRSAAVLDLGCTGPAGFRGWSGGARRSFVIAPDAATPGYLAGELEPGTWQVIIGIHQLPAEGVDYRLAAEVSSR